MVDLGGYVIILVETKDKKIKLYGKNPPSFAYHLHIICISFAYHLHTQFDILNLNPE